MLDFRVGLPGAQEAGTEEHAPAHQRVKRSLDNRGMPLCPFGRLGRFSRLSLLRMSTPTNHVHARHAIACKLLCLLSSQQSGGVSQEGSTTHASISTDSTFTSPDEFRESIAGLGTQTLNATEGFLPLEIHSI